MVTKNATLTDTDWLDVEELASVSFSDGDVYTITLRGGVRGEVCIAGSQPDVSFKGHPLTANQNFTYKHTTGNKVYIKGDMVGATLVVS